MSSYRKLHFGTEVWTYRICNCYKVEVRDPQRKRYVIDVSKMLNLSCDELVKGSYKGWFHITPSQIKKYIVEHFKGTKNVSTK